MTSESSKNRLATHAKLTSGWRQSQDEIIKSLCNLADADEEGIFSSVLAIRYPLLQYIAEAAGIDSPSIEHNNVHVTVTKSLVPDLSAARAPFVGFLGQKAAEDMFPDWTAEDIHTEIEIRNERLEGLYSHEHSSYDIHLAFAVDGRLLRGRLHVSPPASRSFEGTLECDVAKIELNQDLVEQVSRILWHELEQARLPRQRPRVTEHRLLQR